PQVRVARLAEVRPGLDPGQTQHPLKRKPRTGARGTPSDPQALQITDGSDPARIAAGDHKPDLAAPQMNQRYRLAGKQKPHVRVVVSLTTTVQQMDRRSLRRPAGDLR